jgi:hypothetical protein
VTPETTGNTLSDNDFHQEERDLHQLAAALKSQKYGFVEDTSLPKQLENKRGLWYGIWQAMKDAMSS